MKRTIESTQMDEAPNEALCIKFAAELIEMVARVKANREAQRERGEISMSPEEVQYFIHTSGTKEFFRHCGGNLKLFLGLSVGNSNQEGAHAAAVVACLQNLGQIYEEWQEGFFTRNRVKADPIEQCVDVDLIVADTSQALNHLPAVEIDLRQAEGQCMSVLTDPRLGQFEADYIGQGEAVEKLYRELFSTAVDHQKHFKLLFRLVQHPTRWGNLKKHFNDPAFIEMMNFLERCFKLGLQKLMDENAKVKFPKEVELKMKNGDYAKWAQVVKVNDLAYVSSEIILLPYQIFKLDPKLGEEIAIALLYTGPMNMVLGSGKNMLASRYAQQLCQSPCFFMQAERWGSDEKQDKNAQLFLGKLDAARQRIIPDRAQRHRCIEFIQKEVGTERGLEVTLAAMRKRNERKDRHAVEQHKRKQEDFESGPFCRFLDSFHHQVAQQSTKIKQCISSNELTWDAQNPIKCMINYFGVLAFSDENDHSPRVRRSHSLKNARDNGYLQGDNELVKMLCEQQTKFLAAISQGVDVQRKQHIYLVRVVTHLVIHAVKLQDKMGEQDLQFKRSKSQVDKPDTQFERSALSRSAEQILTVYRINPQERIMLGILYYIQQISTQSGITLSEMKNPEYYPTDKPPADYVSTQEALTSSGSGLGSL